MFRRLFNSNQLLALVLPLALLASWATCLAVCGETAAHHDNFAHPQLTKSENDCLDSAVQPESCQTTANAVVLQERQTLKTAALAAAVSPSLPFRVLPVERAARLPEMQQNSPPKLFSERLFVRFRAFRI